MSMKRKSSNHTAAMVYDESIVRPVLERVLKSVLASQPALTGGGDESSTKLFAALETYGRKPTTDYLMSDGDHAGYNDAFKKASATNELSSILGSLTWRDHMSEKLMWAFAAEKTPVLRERLITLASFLIRWLVEIDMRENSKRAGTS